MYRQKLNICYCGDKTGFPRPGHIHLYICTYTYIFIYLFIYIMYGATQMQCRTGSAFLLSYECVSCAS